MVAVELELDEWGSFGNDSSEPPVLGSISYYFLESELCNV